MNQKPYRIGKRDGKNGLHLITDNTYRDLDFLKNLVAYFERLRFYSVRYRLLKKSIEMIESNIEGFVFIEEETEIENGQD